MSKKPVVLMVLDGYGLSDHKEGNAIAIDGRVSFCKGRSFRPCSWTS